MYARKEMEGAENWLEPYLDTPPETLPWSDDDDQWQDADVSAREILTSAAADGETEGDQLLRELEDTDPPRHGNSLVRIGRYV